MSAWIFGGENMAMVDDGEGVILITDGTKPETQGAWRMGVEGGTFVVLSEGPPPWTSAGGAEEAE